MMFSMARQTKNLQVVQRIVMPIFINMMNFEFTFGCITTLTNMRKIMECHFSIARNSINESRVLTPFRFLSDFLIKTFNFFVHAFSRTMNSMRFSWTNLKRDFAFRANLVNSFPSIVFVKTKFAAKNISIIIRRYCERISALFTALRFPVFGSRSKVASFTAVNLPLIISRDFLITLFAIHADEDIRNTLTSQSYRREYG